MKSRVFFLLCVGVLMFAGAASAQLYGLSNGIDLFTIDITTGAGTLVGTMTDPGGTGSITEMEYDEVSGRAFAQASDGAFYGFEFDITTATVIGGSIANSGAYNGLEVIGGMWYGTVIFGSAGPSELRTIDPFTGVSTLIGLTGIGPVSGLAYDQATATMYGVEGGPGGGGLYTINMSTGAATLIGPTGIGAGAIEFGPDGQLYAGGNNNDGGNFYSIDTTTGQATLIGATGFPSVHGMGLVPLLVAAPIPSTNSVGMVVFVLLVSIGAFMLLRRRVV